MTNHDTSPATKEDLRESEQRIMRYFDVKTEQLVHDFKGIFSDRTEQHRDKLRDHDRRLTRIESQLGLVV